MRLPAPVFVALAVLPLTGCIQRLVIDATTPPNAFADFVLPAAPDYASPAAWTALPDRVDEADAIFPDDPGVYQAEAPADAFYVHPTSYVGKAWVAPVDDPKLNTTTDLGSTRIQASAFNACCAVYGPRYRQANMNAFFAPTAELERAVDVAYQDVRAAFHAFLARRGVDRPFLLVGHSQGAILATRLLREEIAPTALREKLVGAWLIGAPLTVATMARDFPQVPLCATATDTSCVVAFNARAPDYELTVFEAQEVGGAGGPRACVNPVTRTPDGKSTAAQNGGALFLDADPPVRFNGYAGAVCVDGTLVVTDVQRPPRDFLSRILDDAIGGKNYHPIEFQLFYADLRANAGERVAAWLAAHAPAVTPAPDTALAPAAEAAEVPAAPPEPTPAP